MIDKLRFKFIRLAMGLLLAVLIVIMGAVNLLNYRSVVKNADSVLEMLIENEGRFPNFHDTNGKKPGDMSPELPYETRFFSVKLNDTGEVIFCDTGKIAAIDTETAIAYAKEVWNKGNPRGFSGEYRYSVRRGEENLIIFIDAGRNLNSFKSFLVISLGISLAGFMFVFALLVVLSERIIRPIAESYEKQKQFITDAGHELKTPLTVINADAAVLCMEVGENEWLEDIQKQTKRLAGLTNELINLSRLEEGTERLQMIEFPLSDVVGETAQSFRAPATAQGKSFTEDIEPMLSLNGDEKSIRQLVSILLDNAMKYSSDNGSIEVTLKKSGRNICLSVYNTVSDLPDDVLEHLFDRFYRADKSRNSKNGGYGLGLAIAKNIVGVHKGKISAESKDGQSLTINVVFTA